MSVKAKFHTIHEEPTLLRNIDKTFKFIHVKFVSII